MRSRIIKLLLLLIALMLQFGAVQNLTVFSFSVNLCVLALIGVSYFSSPAEAAAFGALIGAMMDGAVGRRFGTQLLLCMYLALAVKAVASEKINNSPALMALYSWLFTAVYYLAYGLLSGAVLSAKVSVLRWLITAVTTASLNMLISLPVFYVTERLTRGRAVHD